MTDCGLRRHRNVRKEPESDSMEVMDGGPKRLRKKHIECDMAEEDCWMKMLSIDPVENQPSKVDNGPQTTYGPLKR